MKAVVRYKVWVGGLRRKEWIEELGKHIKGWLREYEVSTTTLPIEGATFDLGDAGVMLVQHVTCTRDYPPSLCEIIGKIIDCRGKRDKTVYYAILVKRVT